MKKSFYFEGGAYHNTHQRLTLDKNGDPPAWIHMVDPIEHHAPGTDLEELTLSATVHIYERRTRLIETTGAQLRYYCAWTPADPPKPAE